MNRRAFARAGFGLAAGFIGTFAVIQAVGGLGGADQPTEIVLGAPDLDAYCKRDTDALAPLLVVANPYGWECAGPIDNVWVSMVIDFDDVCQWQFDERAQARLDADERPEGWRCVTDA